jgi:hypothetical protein
VTLHLLDSKIVQARPDREQFACPARLLAAPGRCFGWSFGISNLRPNFPPALRNGVWGAAEPAAELLKSSFKLSLLSLNFRSQDGNDRLVKPPKVVKRHRV